MQRSLLNFFSRCPGAQNGDSRDISSTNLLTSTNNSRSLKSPSPEISPRLSPRNVKRRRVILESSDEDEESADCGCGKIASGNKENLSFKLSEFACISPIPSVQSDSRPSKNMAIRNGNQCQAPGESSMVELDGSFVDCSDASWEHLSLPFLHKDNVMDSSHRKPSHPDFDCRTLYVPSDFLAKQTPGMRQWWNLKSKYADVLLLFKMGKFYELYHMDAMIAVEVLGLVFMKGSYAHCGFPEIAFSRMAEILVGKGYKVGRVEQTESVECMTERTRGKPSSEKVVRREVCQLLTPGTCTASMRSEVACTLSRAASDIECDGPNLKNMIDSPESCLIALTERDPCSCVNEHIFGVALLNASNGRLLVGQFTDDRHCSRLRTFLSHHFPNQVLAERGAVSTSIKSLFNTCLSGIPVEYLARGKQFWTARDTVAELETADYFSSRQVGMQSDLAFSGKGNWPAALLSMLSEDDPLGRSVKPNCDLALSCLGAVVFYLRYCLIDREVMSLGLIETYSPLDTPRHFAWSSMHNVKPFYLQQSSLVLDSITLANLDILRNSSTGTREGTLVERLDTCCTPFGRRLLRRWLTAPPCNPGMIRARQDAVENLMELGDLLGAVKDYLRRMPDFERLLTKIHLLGARGKDKSHPDNRAILYEEVQYSRKNIVDFVATLNGFEMACEMLQHLETLCISSPHLKALTRSVEHGGQFPSLSSKITYFKNAFDSEKAKRDGRITPEPGVDKDYDRAVKEIQVINNELDTFLIDCGKQLGVRISYWGTARNRFQLEVPESSVSRVPSSWQLASQRKGVKRYRCEKTIDWLTQLMAAEERKDASLRGIMQTLFASFSDSFTQWHTAMRCIAELDCLLALANYSLNASNVTCRPEFVELTDNAQQPFLEIVDGLHPCLINTFSGNDLIPNSVYLGSSSLASGAHHPLTLLVTGPNMGGKSTLMRQTALLVILAHLGCRLPATSCRLTSVDRIFSRLGATDRLLAGESTFMVELSETAAILSHISSHSLVLMDELGRGTSTHDGAALASAVLHYLATPTYQSADRVCGPRTLFSTHYHSLVDEVTAENQSSVAHIDLGHMACMVEEQSEAEPGLENITFLYKFVSGACPKSYGFNAARLAHLPDEVIQMGLAKAKEYERTMATFECFRKLLSGTMNPTDVKEWRSKLKVL
ncbi:hypothetical protein EG68_06644 [Paragonimus skrjabini miyazakii]|uniref:DNA mismatch repair protein n=1 Tax=Paragonimus skrjabini miyazakii TaxID=59628 RepID=A0A8S9YWL7_9TREM|nr:hypothetical protein EG68_06644 [Paragonimus skrjabini miyazakii]